MNEPPEQGHGPSTGDSGASNELERVLDVVRRRIKLIAACFVLTAVAAFGLSLLQEERYTASASLLFRDDTAVQSVFGADSFSVSGADAIRQAATNLQLVGLRVVSDRTAEALDSGMTATDVSDAVAVSAEGQSDVIQVSAVDPDPAAAAQIANTFAEQFIRFRARADRSKLLAAKRLAEDEFKNLDPASQDGPRGEQLSKGAERLGILASLQTGNAELVQPAAVPGSPSSPKPLRNTAIGMVLGILLGIALAFLLERLNKQIRTPAEAEAVFGMPTLVSIPTSKAIADQSAGRLVGDLPFSEIEAFRTLRSSLRYFSVDREIRTVLVTSRGAQAGKSTVSWNLARAAASSSSVVLVETDLRNPSLARRDSRIGVQPGLAEALTHQVDLSDVIQPLSFPRAGADDMEHMNIITAGAVPPNPAGLIESRTMTEVLNDLRERYEFVVIDTPPTGLVSDAFPLVQQVDGVIVVARLSHTTRDGCQELRDQLERLGAPVLGLACNGLKTKGLGAYGYGYYGNPPPVPGPTELSRS